MIPRAGPFQEIRCLTLRSKVGNLFEGLLRNKSGLGYN